MMHGPPITEYTIPLGRICSKCGKGILSTENYSYSSERGSWCRYCGNKGLTESSVTESGGVLTTTPGAVVITPGLAVKEESVDATTKTSFVVSRDVERKLRGSSRRIVYDSRTEYLEVWDSTFSARPLMQIPRDDADDLISALHSVLDQVVRAEAKLREGKAP